LFFLETLKAVIGQPFVRGVQLLLGETPIEEPRIDEAL